MKAVIDYVSQDVKTLDESGVRYLTGVNCLGNAAYQEFMATKNLFGKRKGTHFYHYEQSFRPGEIKSYDEAHQIGIELAKKMFPGYEVLVGTHLDAKSDGVQRVHNHFVINSVSYKDGKKIQLGPRSVEQMRRISDEICREHELSVLPEYKQTFGSKVIDTREYRVALRGDSWKFQCINDIEKAMTMVGSKDEFISLMESAGYAVMWTDSRKYITYTCPNGMKVRDNKLHESKFLKENMEYEFAIRQANTEGRNPIQAQGGVEVGSSKFGNASKDGDSSSDSKGAMGGVSRVSSGGNSLSAGDILGAFQESDGGADRPNSVRPLCESSGMVGDLVGKVRGSNGMRGAENGSGYGKSDLLQRENACTGWEEARGIFEQIKCGCGRETDGYEEAHSRVEDVDNVDNKHLSRSFNDRILNSISDAEIKEYFAGDEDIPDDFPLDDDGEFEQIKNFSNLKYQVWNGNVYAMYRLAKIFLDKSGGNYNENLGLYYLEKSAEGGYNYAQYRMGKMFLFGICYDPDIENAEHWLCRSADKGNLYACALLGRIYVEDIDGFLGVDRNRGFQRLFEAERNGNEYAAYTLGKYYMEGKVVKKDIAKAIEYLEKASARGNMFANYRLAEIYLFEADIFDIDKAVDYLNQSAQAGNEYARIALNRMAQNSLIALTTDILSIVGDLANLESRRRIEDCTTIPQVQNAKKQKKSHEWEQSM